MPFSLDSWTIFYLAAGAVVFVLVVFVLPSIRIIGPTEVGLVTKRFSFRKLPDDNPIAFHGEAGYQADLLMPGWRFKFWVVYAVDKHPWVQVRAGEIGVVVSQVGKALPVGAKSAESMSPLNTITDLRHWLHAGGQKGVQRPVLPPGSLMPVHPVGFLVITRERVYGRAGGQAVPAVAGLRQAVVPGLRTGRRPAQGHGDHAAFGPRRRRGRYLRHHHHAGRSSRCQAGAIASRLGEFDDIKRLEAGNATDQTLIECLIGLKSMQHNNYQDFDAFLKAGGRIGLQHDPLLYGAYLLNPFLVRVEEVPMLVVNQGEVAVIKAYVGLPTEDMSGAAFKFGSIVRPGHRGIWQRAVADRQVCHQPPLLRGRARAHRHPEPQLVARRSARPTSSTSGSRRSWPRAGKASFSRSSWSCRSTCPTPRPRG